jgi:DNA-binding transcriptional LysR family regulator
MTQPGVTQHIHYLENHYGVKLFEYDGRSLYRTPSADRLKRYFDSVRAEEVDFQKNLSASERVNIRVGATKTIGEFVIVPNIRKYLASKDHALELTVDNTEVLLHMLDRSEIDFAIIEGVFDKSKYGYHLYKKEKFVGICAKSHAFAGKTVSIDELLAQDLVVRERYSGTRNLFQNAIADRGFSFDSFARCTSVSNFSVICDLVANNGAITFAYEPISRCRGDLATFSVSDMQISGEFNFVYCNERVARVKIGMIFN